jgi:Brp/Blh family beta-carotene 15,15'-monooxygenase
MSLCGMALVLVPDFWQALGCIGLIGLIGFPHGGLDAYIMWSQCERSPRRFARQIATYLFVAFLALSWWWFSPLTFWSAFLAISVYHFGVSSDLFPAEIPKHEASKWISFFSKGLLIVFGAALSYPVLVYDLFSVASSPEFAKAFVGIAPSVIFVAAASALILAAVELSSPEGKAFAVSVLLQSVLLFLLFALIPPLISFTLYFVFIHSIPQMLKIRTGFPKISSKILIAVGMVFSLPPLAILAVVLAQEISWSDWASRGRSYIFVVLAVLNFPHFWLYLFERRSSSWSPLNPLWQKDVTSLVRIKVNG